MAMKTRSVFLLAMTSCLFGPMLSVAAPPAVQIDNVVAACLAIEPHQMVTQGNLLLLPARLKTKHTLADCGCKAAALTYRVTDHKGHHVHMAEFWSLKRDETPEFDFTFVLEPDTSVNYTPPFVMTIGCANPP
jgi:hypothetical protein